MAAACLAAAACATNSAPVITPAPSPEPPSQPAAPASPPGHVHAAPAGPTTGALPPDAQFLHHMIPHHAQALVMTSLVPARALRPELRLVAERIAVSQQDEIAQMQAWLRARGHPAPDAGSHGGMPGMLTPEELASLAAARGPAFDRLFLELMIRHHEGAITMVQDLFARGGGQDSQIYAMASDVESDQRMEIARMRALLATMPSVSADR